MARERMFGNSNGAILATVIAAVLLIGAAIGYTSFRGAGDTVAVDAPTDGAPELVEVPTEGTPAGQAALDGATNDEVTAGEGSADDTESDGDPASGDAAGGDAIAAALDLVRIDADGNTLIAGQSEPGVSIAVLLDGVEIAVTEADGVGDFVAMVALEPSDSPRSIAVEVRRPDGTAVAGGQTVIVAPFAGTQVAEVTPETQTPITPETLPEAGDAGGGAQTGDAVLPEVGTADAIGGEASEIEIAAITPETTTPITPATPEAGAAPAPGGAQGDGAADPEDARLPEDTVSSATVGTAVPDPAAGATGGDAVAPGDGAADTAVTEAVTGAATGAAPDAAPAIGDETAALAGPDENALPTVPSPESQPATQATPALAAAPTVLITGPDGVQIAQGPGDRPDALTTLRLDAISYDATGAVILAGRGPETADVRVYLNNEPIQVGDIGADGQWSLQLRDVDPGAYTLSLAQVAEDGTERRVVETPFLREDPERVIEVANAQADAAALEGAVGASGTDAEGAADPAETFNTATDAAGGVTVITVQTGFTLWGIARESYGDGILYVQIFEENRDEITDPDLIYPGQIFRIPEAATADGSADP